MAGQNVIEEIATRALNADWQFLKPGAARMGGGALTHC